MIADFDFLSGDTGKQWFAQGKPQIAFYNLPNTLANKMLARVEYWPPDVELPSTKAEEVKGKKPKSGMSSLPKSQLESLLRALTDPTIEQLTFITINPGE